MCFGAPKAPEIVYKGPSQEDIDANNQALEDFRTETEKSNQAFMDNMQVQIDKANQEMEQLQSKFEAEQLAAQSAAANFDTIQRPRYAVVVWQSRVWCNSVIELWLGLGLGLV